jgi:hypothetical protein
MKGYHEPTKRQDEKGVSSVNDIRKEVFVYNDIFNNPLEKNLFVYSRKIEKIVAALYLVTDVMDPELPLTKSLRLESLDLLNACFQILTGNNALNPGGLTKVLVRLEHVTSLVSIGKIAHHISEMNAHVLVTELQKVTQLMGADTQELAKKYTSYLYPRTQSRESSQPILSHTTLDDTAFEDLEKTRKRQNDIKTTLTTSINDKIPSTHSQIGLITKTGIVTSIKTTSKTTFEKSDRKQEIMNVIRSHKNATMVDIQKYVTGCSDKTLQRAIVDLIQDGQVQTVGDKRWATYHVV